VRDINRTGAFIAAAVQNGALYQSLSFDLSDREAREDALRVKAAANAMHRATLYAEGATMKLGALKSLGADGGSFQPLGGTARGDECFRGDPARDRARADHATRKRQRDCGK